MKYKVEKWKRENAPKAEELQSEMEREGYRVFQWSDGVGRTYGDHSHGEDQSHWIISGSLELTVEGFGKVVLEPGDRDFMPANTIHSARVIGDEPVVYLIGARV